MNTQTIVLNIISWLFGMAVLAVGLINKFFGSDPGFEVFLAFFSLIYLPPINDVMKETLGFAIPATVKSSRAFLLSGYH